MRSQLLYYKLSPDAAAPVRAHLNDSGMDFFCLEDVNIMPGETTAVRTGIAVQLNYITDEGVSFVPEGYNDSWTLACFAWDKSGLSLRGLIKSAGCIDNAYTGEIVFVITYLPTATLWATLIGLLDRNSVLKEISRMMRLTNKPFTLKKGDKICQLVVQRIELPIIMSGDIIPETDRGDRGFGSTGS